MFAIFFFRAFVRQFSTRVDVLCSTEVEPVHRSESTKDRPHVQLHIDRQFTIYRSCLSLTAILNLQNHIRVA